ncbi:hypothetical protein T484DRAFT_3281557 [Baffinella frigidus]|nr:hypothetical protein T484DRAFT_3281557 [Cryptophyta sp. CCMP2293]
MTPSRSVIIACLLVLALCQAQVSALNLQKCDSHEDCKYEGCRAGASDTSGSCGSSNHIGCGVCSSAGGGFCTGWKGNCYLYGYFSGYRVDAGNCDNCGMRLCPAGSYSETGKGTGEVASPYGCTVCPEGGDSVEGSVNCTFQLTSPPPLEEVATPAPDAVLNLQRCASHDDCKYEGCRAGASDVSGSCGSTNHIGCGVCSSAGGGFCTGWKGNCYLYGYFNGYRVDAGNCDNCGLRMCPAGTYSTTGRGTGEVASPYGCTVCPAGADSAEGSTTCAAVQNSAVEDEASPDTWGPHVRWGADPSVAGCAIGTDWDGLIARAKLLGGGGVRTGGLGNLSEAPRFEVWVCEDRHACANGTSSSFCFVFDEVANVFVPWGPNSQLRLFNYSMAPTKEYRYFETRRTQPSAAIACEEWGGQLASVRALPYPTP